MLPPPFPLRGAVAGGCGGEVVGHGCTPLLKLLRDVREVLFCR